MTFSIVARDPKMKVLGVAVCTAMPAAGSVIPHAEGGVGAIATQAKTNVLYGIEGLKLLKSGFSPQAALETMLQRDVEREKRQVIIIDAQGRKAAFTGRENDEWKGHMVGKDCVTAGNTLAGNLLVKAMIETFEAAKGNLAERLLEALVVGQKAGGDKRGQLSAALLVAGEQCVSETRPVLDLRVDAHEDPVAELRRVYTISSSYFQVPE